MDARSKSLLERAKKCYELKELERLGLTPDLDQRKLILDYISLLLRWNPVASLISPGDEDHLFLRHFCDSLQPLLLFGFKKNAKVFDVGAGGGFPSIPIRILRPDVTFVLAESNRKKASFLREVISQLGLDNVSVFGGRAARMEIPNPRFDYVMSRGLGTLVKFSALGKPFLACDGRLYTFKTKQFRKELAEVTENKAKNGVAISEIAEYDLGNQIHGLNLISLALM